MILIEYKFDYFKKSINLLILFVIYFQISFLIIYFQHFDIFILI